MAEPRAGIKIGLDTTDLQAELRRLGEQVKASFTELSATFDVFTRIGGAISNVVGTLNKYAAAAGAVDVIQRRATAAIGGSIEALKALNNVRQTQLGIDADDQLKLQTRLAQLGVQKSKLNEATEATIGLANATGRDLKSAGELVTKVYGGNYKALAELGIKVDSVAQAQARLAELYRVSQTEIGSYTRNVAALDSSVGDAGEAFGALLINTRELNAALADTALQVSLLNRVLNSDTFKAFWDVTVSGVTSAFWDGLGKLTFGISDHLREGAKSMADIERNLQKIDQIRAKSGYSDPWLESFNAEFQRRRSDPNYRGAFGEAGFPGLTVGAEQPGFNVVTGGKSPTKTRAKPEDNSRSYTFDDVGFGEDPNFALADASLAAANTRNGFSRTTDDGGEMKDRLAAQYQDGMAFSKEAQAQIQQLAEGAASGLGNVLGSMIQAMVEGSANLGELLSNMVGMMITNLGMLLLQTGAAAVALGALSLIPGLNFITGPPGVAIASGAVALGVGAGLVAIGSAMGGGGSSAGATSAPRGASGGGRGSTQAPRYFGRDAGDTLPLGMAGGNGPPAPIVVNFNGVVGDKRAVAREIRDVLRVGDLSRGGA